MTASQLKVTPLKQPGRVFQGLVGATNWLQRKTRQFVTDPLSRGVTTVSATAGFAHRGLLTKRVNALTGANDELILDELVSKEILKDSFRKGLPSLEYVQPRMISATTPLSQLGSLEQCAINAAGLDAQKNIFVSKVVSGMSSGYRSVVHYLDTHESLSIAFAKGAKYASFVLAGVTGLWYSGLPSLPSSSVDTLVLASGTALCAIAAKFNNKFSLQGAYGFIGEAARYISRRVGPWYYALSGLYLGNLVYNANLRITSIFDSLGLEATTAFALGLALAINHFVKKNANALKAAYGGMLDPGMMKYMQRLMSGAAYSTAAETHYLGTRLLLLGSATTYLFLNTAAAFGTLGVSTLLIPLAGFGLTHYLRSKNEYTYNKKETADIKDHFKVWTPLWGLAAGLTAAAAAGIASGSGLLPIAYLTFYGSVGTYFINELHGSFHSINTNLGLIAALKASARDLFGKNEIKRLIGEAPILLINPHTGTKEHSTGFLFNLLLNRKPGLSFVVMFDRILAEAVPFKASELKKLQGQMGLPDQLMQQVVKKLFKKPAGNGDVLVKPEIIGQLEATLDSLIRDGLLNAQQRELIKKLILGHLQSHQDDKSFMDDAEALQREIYERAQAGIYDDPRHLLPRKERYRRLAENLKGLAGFYDGELHDRVRLTLANNQRFDDKENVAAFLRAGFEQLSVRAEEFRKMAQNLERMVDKEYISEDYFDAAFSTLLACYDPDLIKKVPIVRKTIAGDEREIRKVENVASILLLIGLPIYKAWKKETTADRFPPVDYISGTWIQLPKKFSRRAAPGTCEAAKFIWVKRDRDFVLTQAQKKKEKNLSTSKHVLSVDNQPAEAEGFTVGTSPMTLSLHDQKIELKAGEYYYVTGPDQNLQPAAKKVNLRPGVAALPDGYEIASLKNARPNADMRPDVFTLPAFDYSLMVDKNDIQINSYTLLPAIIKRASQDKFLHLLMRQPLAVKYEFDNPLPGLPVDKSKGIHIVDANLELSHKGLVIPVKLDRGAAHVGINESVIWQGLTHAKVKTEAGKLTYFALIYRGLRKDALKDFEHGVIAKKQLAVFGGRAEEIWKALQAKGYMNNGVIQAKFYERGEKFSLGTEISLNWKEKRQLFKIMVDAVKTEDIWKALHQAGYVGETDGDLTIIQQKFEADGKKLSFPTPLPTEIADKLSLILQEHIVEMELPPQDQPRYLGLLGLPAVETEKANGLLLAANNFCRAPHREGDSSWAKITYTDGTIAFARTADGKRPMLFNKDLIADHNPPGEPLYYQIVEAGNKIRITNVHVQRGTSVFIPRGWDRDLKKGARIESLSKTLPDWPGAGHESEMLGMVYTYDQAGKEVGTPYVTPLGNYIQKDRADHVQAAIEIVPNKDKLTVVERRMDGKGLAEDRSKFVYTLTAGGAKMIEDKILDINWIDDVRVTPKREAVITYTTPGSKTTKELTLPAICFRDNFGKNLLGNKKAGMSRLDDLYQSHDEGDHPVYTRETTRFKPMIDEFNGNLRLVVHKVKRYEIDRPKELPDVPAGGTVKIFPAAADAMARVKGQNDQVILVPLALSEPIDLSNQAQAVDLTLSKVEDGVYKSAIGPQTRFGEPGNISSEYVRDPYFYGLLITAMFRGLEKWGETVAVNRDKGIRADRAIQSGRTHTMMWDMIYNELGDYMETNNEFYLKLSNFCEEIWSVGVSEDTQMEMAYWLKGIKMWAVKEMVALMPAETGWGQYDRQNTQRYDYSEVLFNLSFLLSKIDILEGRLLGKRPVMMKWAEMSEIAAGKTWYKMAFAKIIEQLSIPTYLLSGGYVLWYPVDLTYFVLAWLGRTVFSSLNYTQHLLSIGYGFITGFWQNPALELTMLGGYFRAAMRQFLDRNQFGTFMATVGGGGALVPKENKRWIWGLAGTTVTSLASTAAFLALGGAISWLVLPMGIAAIPVGLHLLARGLSHHDKLKKFTFTAGGLTALAVGAAKILLTAGVLWTSPISLAIVVNVIFGMYAAGLLGRSLLEMRRAENEQGLLKAKNAHQKKLAAEDARTVDRISFELRAGATDGLSYQELLDQREALREILRKIRVMNQKGTIRQGVDHPYRMASHNILDLYSRIEMMLAQKAARDLVENGRSENARQVLLNLLEESSEYLIIDFVAKTYRRFHLDLSGPAQLDLRPATPPVGDK